MSTKLLLAAAIASLVQAESLRGNLHNPPLALSPLLESRISGSGNSSHRQLPNKDIKELKRINSDRKKLNQEARRKKEKTDLVIEKSAWKVC